MCRAAAPCIIHLLTVPGHPPQCGRTFTADYLHLTSRLILDQSLWIYFAVCQVVHLKLKLQAAGLVRNSVSAWIIYYEKLVHIYYVSCHKENKVAGNGFVLGPKKKNHFTSVPLFLSFTLSIRLLEVYANNIQSWDLFNRQYMTPVLR